MEILFTRIHEIPTLKEIILNLTVAKGFVDTKKKLIQELELLLGVEQLSLGNWDQSLLHFKNGMSITTELTLFCCIFAVLVDHALKIPEIGNTEILALNSTDFSDSIISALKSHDLATKPLDLITSIHLQRLQVAGYIPNNVDDWFNILDGSLKYRKDYKIDYTRTITHLDVQTYVLLCSLEQQVATLKSKLNLFAIISNNFTIPENRSKFYLEKLLILNDDMSTVRRDAVKNKQQMLLELRGLVYPKFKNVFGLIGLYYHSCSNSNAARYYLKRFEEMANPTREQFSKEITRPHLFLDLFLEVENVFDLSEISNRVQAALDSQLNYSPNQDREKQKSSPQKQKLLEKLEKVRIANDKTPQKNESEQSSLTPIISTKAIPGYFGTPVPTIPVQNSNAIRIN